MLRFFTAGESHGKCLTAILEGMVAGLNIDEEKINMDLARRQKGYGRGGRMQIETDKVEILSGLRKGQTIGSPISLMINNKDFCIDSLPEVTNPRPGHADLAGIVKYNRKDARDILERSSARETAVRVAVGAIIKQFLSEMGIEIFSHVVSIGDVSLKKEINLDEGFPINEDSELNCVCKQTEQKMKKLIDKAIKQGSSLGGVFEVIVTGVPIGLGSHVQWDRKLDARLVSAMVSIQAVKGAEIGTAFENTKKMGHFVHDEIFYEEEKGYFHNTNRAGGIEGSMSNGENLIIRAAMKPIPTLINGLKTININDKSQTIASVERSDYCAVPAACVVGEAAVAFEIANAFFEKFGGDSLEEVRRNYGKNIEA